MLLFRLSKEQLVNGEEIITHTILVNYGETAANVIRNWMFLSLLFFFEKQAHPENAITIFVNRKTFVIIVINRGSM